MAQIDKLYKSMGLPMNIKRGNPWPLDASSLWYSYDEMKAYAEDADSVAYVGQILGLVDEENDSAEAYIIANSNGALKPIGSGKIIVDSKTIMIDSESDEIGLKDFGKRFYKYTPEVKDDEGNVVLEASYELTEVSDANPWAAGLEPRVVSENGVLVLGWFEPNPTTIDGVNNQVSSLQTSVSDLQKVAEDLVAEIGSPAEDGAAASGIYAEIDKKANAADVFTKDETLEQIATAVNNIDHLQRKIVSSYADIVSFIEQEGADEAAKYIFMVPETDTTADGNIYEEYIVVNGVIEVIGKWATDLSDYVTEKELTEVLKGYITPTSLDTKLEEYVTNESLEDYVDSESLNSTLNNYATKADLNGYATNADLELKVDKVEGSRLITEEEAERLNNLPESLIKSVDSVNFFVDTEGKLSLKTDAQSAIGALNTSLNEAANSLVVLTEKVNTNEATITNLSEAIANLRGSVDEVSTKYKTAQEAINDLNQRMVSTEEAVATNTSLINSLNEALSNYVTKDTYNADIAELKDILTWKDMDNE